jgi:hypothetical protein
MVRFFILRQRLVGLDFILRHHGAPKGATGPSLERGVMGTSGGGRRIAGREPDLTLVGTPT